MIKLYQAETPPPGPDTRFYQWFWVKKHKYWNREFIPSAFIECGWEYTHDETHQGGWRDPETGRIYSNEKAMEIICLRELELGESAGEAA